LFTGQEGAQSLPQLISSVPAQGASLSKTLQQAQTSLQSAGAISGAETASQIGGMVLATTNNGLNSTLDAVKSLGNPGAAIAGVAGEADGVIKDIASGNFASGIGEGIAGPLSGIKNSVDALIKSPSLDAVVDQAKGVAASAFSAIKASLKPLEAGVPQNLTEIAKKSAEDTMAASASGVNEIASQTDISLDQVDAVGGAATGLLNQAKSILPNAGSVADSLVKASSSLGSVTGNNALASATGKLSAVSKTATTVATAFASPSSLSSSLTSAQGLAQTASNIKSGLISTVNSSVASGLSKLPGGQGMASAVTNLATGALPSLPGTGTLKDAITGSFNKALTGVDNLTKDASDLLSKATSSGDGLKGLLSAGLPAGAASELQSAMSSLASPGSGIKIPSVGFNTTDRSTITEAVTSQLGDPGIPTPTFGEIDEAAEGTIDDIEQQRIDYIAETSILTKERVAAEANIEAKQDAYLTAQFNYPAGDPAIDEARDEYYAAIEEWEIITAQIDDLPNQYPAIASSTTPNVAGGPVGPATETTI
jgi:hypothetical protein